MLIIAISCGVVGLIFGLWIGFFVASRVYLRDVVRNKILHAVNRTLARDVRLRLADNDKIINILERQTGNLEILVSVIHTVLQGSLSSLKNNTLKGN